MRLEGAPLDQQQEGPGVLDSPPNRRGIATSGPAKQRERLREDRLEIIGSAVHNDDLGFLSDAHVVALPIVRCCAPRTLKRSFARVNPSVRGSPSAPDAM